MVQLTFLYPRPVDTNVRVGVITNERIPNKIKHGGEIWSGCIETMWGLVPEGRADVCIAGRLICDFRNEAVFGEKTARGSRDELGGEHSNE